MKKAETKNEQQTVKVNYTQYLQSHRKGIITVGCEEKETSKVKKNSRKSKH